MKGIAVWSIALLVSANAFAKPSPEVVKQVVDFYFDGQDQGVVLAHTKLCDNVYTKGEHNNECMDERADNTLTLGEQTNVWMLFMVPNKVEPQSIMVQLNHRGMTMSVQRAKIASALRYRIWRKIKPDRAGDWTVKILHDRGDEVELLKEMTLTVVEPPAESPPGP